MSFTAPNHARALFWGLFATWLYVASVVWFCAFTARGVDPISMALGSVSLGMLVYGTAVVHRVFLVNAVPFGATTFDLFGDAPRIVEAAVQIGSSAVLLVSSLAIGWVVYHAYRERVTLGRSLPLAFTLGLPILLYETSRHLLGIDIYESVVSALLMLTR